MSEQRERRVRVDLEGEGQTFSASYDVVHEAVRAALARIPRVVVTGQDPEAGEVIARRRGLLPWVVDQVVVALTETPTPSGPRVRVSIRVRPWRGGAACPRTERTAAAIRAALEEEVLKRARRLVMLGG